MFNLCETNDSNFKAIHNTMEEYVNEDAKEKEEKEEDKEEKWDTLRMLSIDSRPQG